MSETKQPEYVRVSDKETGHEYTIPAHLFDERAHRLLKKPAVDVRGVAIPTKFKVLAKPSVPPTDSGPKAEDGAP